MCPPNARLWVRIVWLLLVLAARPATVRAQEPTSAPARATLQVRQVAGANVYLDRGTAGGLVAGDTVQVFRPDGSALGALAVVAATATRSVLTFVGAPFPLGTGDTVAVELARAPPVAADPGPEPSTPVRGAAPQQASPAATAPRVSGRMTLELGMSHSVTELGVVDPVDVSRTLATPALRLNATVSNLFGGFTLRTGGRVSYRYTSGMPFGRPTTVRVHDLALERRFQRIPLQLTMGRFFSPAESFSGYWDGIATRVGGASFGGGLLLGFEPDRWSRAPSLDLPKATGFVDYRLGRGRTRWEGDVSVNLVAPRLEGWSDHLFLGFGQRVTLGPLRVRAEVQADREPQGGGFRVGEAVAQATVALAPALSLRVGGARRERFTVSAAVDPFGPRRDRVGAGLSVRAGRLSASADYALNRYQGGRDRNTWSGALAVAGVPGLPAGSWRLNGSWWSGDRDEALSAGTSLGFVLSGVRTRVGYQFRSSTFVGRTRVTHAPELALDVPMRAGFSATVRARGTFGSEMIGQYLHLALTRAF